VVGFAPLSIDKSPAASSSPLPSEPSKKLVRRESLLKVPCGYLPELLSSSNGHRQRFKPQFSSGRSRVIKYCKDGSVPIIPSTSANSAGGMMKLRELNFRRSLLYLTEAL